MSFATAAEVKSYVMYDETRLNDTVVTQLIADSDAYISKRTGTTSVTGTTDTNNFRTLSCLLTAIKIKNQDPTSIAIGDDYRAIHSPQGRWREEAEEIFKLYEDYPITTYNQPLGEVDY